MKRFLIVPLLLITVGFGAVGCAVVDKISSTISNPVTQTNMYQVKLGYAAAEELMLQYYDKCFGVDGKKTYKEVQADSALSVLCKRRVSRWYAMKAADNKAYAAIGAADTFVKNNPSGNAVSYITAAWKAVGEFKAQVSN